MVLRWEATSIVESPTFWYLARKSLRFFASEVTEVTTVRIPLTPPMNSMLPLLYIHVPMTAPGVRSSVANVGLSASPQEEN